MDRIGALEAQVSSSTQDAASLQAQLDTQTAAAEASKELGGKPIAIADIMKSARKAALKKIGPQVP